MLLKRNILSTVFKRSLAITPCHLIKTRIITAVCRSREINVDGFTKALLNSSNYSAKYSEVPLPTEFKKYAAVFQTNELQDKDKDAVEKHYSNSLFVVFRNGPAVFWDFESETRTSLCNLIKQYSSNHVRTAISDFEQDFLSYIVNNGNGNGAVKVSPKDGVIKLPAPEVNLPLETFCISHALGLSVLLGVYESSMKDVFAPSISSLTEGLTQNKTVIKTAGECLQLTGSILELRNQVGLYSDVFSDDVPNIYWDHEHVQPIFAAVIRHLCIANRVDSFNIRVNHCLEILQVCSSYLADRRHVNLEWLIIFLITIEVLFEVRHIIVTRDS